MTTTNKKWELFICHASEDKAEVAYPLAKLLEKNKIKVWYDEFSLKIGDSLRRSIDKGLSNSRFGLVILSPSFFKKEWPQKELDGLTAREIDGTKVIFPIWHNITKEQVLNFSPTLADKFAIETKEGIDFIANKISQEIKDSNNTFAVLPYTQTKKKKN